MSTRRLNIDSTKDNIVIIMMNLQPMFPTCQQGSRQVKYCLAMCIYDYILADVHDEKTPKGILEEPQKDIHHLGASTPTRV